jgi:DNA-3-methyladenine glycosylase
VRLGRAFFARDTRAVARDLLGKVLVHVDGGVRRAARIVETEAYHGPGDRASHARFGPTRRAAVMFGPPGHAYVYLVYGRSHCVNVVTGREGFPAAVLLRAGEPVEGCLHSTRGPGNLCRALAITRAHDGLDLADGALFVEDAPPPAERVSSGRRVNVDYAGPWAEKPWRYALSGNPWVSKPSVRPGLRARRAGTRSRSATPSRPARPPRPRRRPSRGSAP